MYYPNNSLNLIILSVYTSKVLLQTTPGHMISSLDKCLREAATLDGVLEFRLECSFDSHSANSYREMRLKPTKYSLNLKVDSSDLNAIFRDPG